MAGDLGDSIFNKLLKLVLKTTIGQVLVFTAFGVAAVAVGVYSQNWYFAILYGVLLVLLLVLKIIRRDRPAPATQPKSLEALGYTPLMQALIWGMWLLVLGGFVVLKKAIEQKNVLWLYSAAGFYGLVFLWSLFSGRIYWGGPRGLVERDRQPLVYLVCLAILLAACAGPVVVHVFFWDR